MQLSVDGHVINNPLVVYIVLVAIPDYTWLLPEISGLSDQYSYMRRLSSHVTVGPATKTLQLPSLTETQDDGWATGTLG